jgi:hypothetical protein
MQGEKMNNPKIKITDSVLDVKAVGSIMDVSADFDCVQTKTIAELLDAEQQEEENNTKKQKEKN